MRKLFFLLWLPASVFAQTPDSLIMSYKATLAQGVNANSAKEITQARAGFEQLLETHPRKDLIHYYIGYCCYSLINTYREKGDQKKTELLIDDAIKHLEASLQLNQTSAEAMALLGLVYGMKASTGMFAGMQYGEKSSAMLEKAMALAPNNPRVLILQGINKFYTPAMFGGDKKKARELFKQATEIFEKNPPEPSVEPTWGYEEAFTWLGIAAFDAKEFDVAKAAFEKALAINPSYGWVKYYWLPKLAAAK
ncbi:MAG: tetratricopeptide repeat protein [Chloroherpetonaceae bacterium]|nr:tetratricopeptide repeat protein [Chloroherpetonaceae bacterium]